MDQDRQSRWRQIIRNVLWTVGIYAALVVAIIIVLGYVREWDWTGLVKDKAYTKRTLWDWLQLLIIPAVLAGVGLWFNRQQREQELQTADRRAQDEALQAYLDQMSAMLIPNKEQPSLYDENPPDSLRTVARARTLTVLPRLDDRRKGVVVQFLSESNLITRNPDKVVHLNGANLRDADLVGLNLRSVGLDGAFLERANLSLAYLPEADLGGTRLYGANLIHADLSGASLWNAQLQSRPDLSLKAANLMVADLSGANLSGADLSGANLLGANLSGAYKLNSDGSKRIVTNEELEEHAGSLKGATLPDGQKYEDWLKSKGREGTGENSGP